MLNLTPVAIMAAAANLLSPALATFDASANTNMAVYWGQGPNQKSLEYFCDDDNIDIIQIGFVNVFPDQSGGYPGTNFGNQCGSETYKNVDGSSSPLLSHCPGVGSNITYCQSIGKKILLSLGGAIPNNQHLNSDVSAVEFATFLWEAFGPEDNSKTTPRPFGDAVVDGFDFDIENVLAQGEDAGDLNRGYGTMVNTLRALYDTDKSKPYYVSAAPQCIVPDPHLAEAIETSPFDFLFIQFYNTRECSARAYFNHSYGGTHTNISFASWVDFVQDKSYNPNTKVYLGLPAAADLNVVYESEMYLQPNEANEIIHALQCEYKHAFGGVMVYEATLSQNNQIQGQPYADVLKGYLKGAECMVKPVTSSATVHSSVTVSSTQAATTTSAVSTTLTVSSANTASSSAVTSSTSVASSTRVLSFSSTTAMTSAVSTTRAVSSANTASSSAVISSTSVASSVGAFTSNYPTAVINATSSSSGKTSASIATSGSSLPAISSGSSTPTSTGEVIVSVTEVSTIATCPPGVSHCPFQSQTTAPTATLVSASVRTLVNGTYSFLSAKPATSTGRISTEQGSIETPVTLFTPASRSVLPPSGPSGSGISSYSVPLNSSRPSPTTSLSSSVYQNAISATRSSAAASDSKSSMPSPIVPGTTISSVLESTEYVSLITYTTITSCPVTFTKVQSGTTSIIVETSLITSTITTCPRCSKKTKSALVPGLASSTPGSPGTIGTSLPGSVPSLSARPSPSSVLRSSPYVVPAGQTSGPLPNPTTYPATEIVSTTQKTTGYSVPTDTGFSSQPLGAAGNANAASTGYSNAGTPGVSQPISAPSNSEAGESNGPQYASSSSSSKESESSAKGSNGSSSKPNGEGGAALPSVGAPSPSTAGTQSKSNSENGISSPGSENKAAAPQESSPEQSTGQGAPSEVGAAGSPSKSSTQSLASSVTGSYRPVVTMEIIPVPLSPSQVAHSSNLASSVTGAHLPVMTMEIIPVPQNPSQTAQSGKANQSGSPGAQLSGQSNGQQSGSQSGQSGQQSNNALISGTNGTAPVSPSGTVSASASATAPGSQGTGNGNSSQFSPEQFKGAAARVGASLFAVIGASAAILLM